MAAHGVRFLRERMWDPRYGGFVWRLDPGRTREWRFGEPRKHLYGQAFAILALSEFALAAGDVEAAELAWQAYALLEERARDAAFGGFLESRARDWSLGPAGRPDVIGRPAGVKTLNAHLHALEGLTALHDVRPEPVLRARLGELIELIRAPFFDEVFGTCRDSCERDWTPVPGYSSSYGHDVECAWLLRRACEATGTDPELVRPVAEALWQHALAHGFDHARGGLFESGPPGAAADRHDRIGWVQAEALISSLTMWQWTGRRRYRDAFVAVLEWIDRFQADDAGGDWHPAIGVDGLPYGEKAGAWNDPYHQGRAVLECLEMLTGDEASEGSSRRVRTRDG